MIHLRLARRRHTGTGTAFRLFTMATPGSLDFGEHGSGLTGATHPKDGGKEKDGPKTGGNMCKREGNERLPAHLKNKGRCNAMRFIAVAIGPTSERCTKMGDAAAPNTPNNKTGKAQRSAKCRTKAGPSYRGASCLHCFEERWSWKQRCSYVTMI